MSTNDEKVKTFQRADGSKLAYAEYGDPEGNPVLYFHGSPGSRLEGVLFSDLFKRKGLRMIALDELNLRLDIDSDSDGVVDDEIFMTWAELSYDDSICP